MCFVSVDSDHDVGILHINGLEKKSLLKITSISVAVLGSDAWKDDNQLSQDFENHVMRLKQNLKRKEILELFPANIQSVYGVCELYVVV